MATLLHRVMSRLFRSRPANPNDELVGQGLMEVGQSCDLSGMNVFIADKRPGSGNIRIGNTCCIRGTLVVYRHAAKIEIGNNVYIGPGTILECAEEIRIGDNVLISSNCNLIDTNSHSLHSYERVDDTADWKKGLAHKNWDIVVSKKLTIGNNSWLGLRTIIMKGVTLGEGTIVAAGSVVTKSSEPFSLVAGNPARFIRNVD